ncbi:MAG: hypothetical protein U0531_19860 [Dehalococcoidia bacterium]
MLQESVGRVLEASVSRFLCACHELDGAPPLGAAVVVMDTEPAIYGVVADMRTEGIDPGRRPAARGGPGDDRAAVLAQNPQIPALLHTLFDCVVVGHARGGEVAGYLPDAPAPIYARVRACDRAETARLFERPELFKLLLASGALADEVAAACLRRAVEGRSDRRAFLVRAGRALAHELATEPDRLTAILSRIRP